MTSGYIPVTPGLIYCFSGNATVRTFDADKNFVKKGWTALYNTSNNTTLRLYQFQEGISYIRFSSKTDGAVDNADYIQHYAMMYQWTGEFYAYNAYHTEYDILLGANDQHNAHTLGSFVASSTTSDFDLNTFYGGLQSCIHYLQNQYPNAILQLGFTPGTGFELPDDKVYWSAMREAHDDTGLATLIHDCVASRR